MKKMTKKNLMRALALLMAVVMVATSGAFSSGGWLRATGLVEDEAAVTDVPADDTTADPVTEEPEEEPAPEPEPRVCADGCTLGEGHEGDCVVEIKICADGCTLGEGHDGDCVLPQPEPEPEPQPEPKACVDGCTLAAGHDGDCVLPQPEEEAAAPQSTCADGCTLGEGHEGECAEAQEKTYTLHIKHELPSAEGTYGEETEVTLKDSDFVDGKYDAAKNAISKAGLSVKSAGVVAKESFDENGEYTVTITYALANRRVIMKSTGPKGTTYLGSISDLKITEKQNVIVTLKFRYDSVDGAQADADMPIMVELSEDGKYYFSETLELPEGYKVSIHNAAFTLSGNTVSATLPGDAEATDVVIVFAAKDANYKVVTKVQKADGSYETSEVVKTGKVGDLTEVITEEREGFSLSAGQEAIKADGSTVVEVQYDRLVHYINYNTMGGSYIPSKSGLHGSEATVYEHIEGQEGSAETYERICGETEHSHNKNCWSCKRNESVNHKHAKKGCRLDCGKTEHTHTDTYGSCYTRNPGQEAVEERWSNPAAPTKAGYTFTGWYTDAACTAKASEKAVLEGDITVYAGWKATEVAYTVVYLIENADDDNYSYFGSVQKQATAGSVVTENANGTKPTGFDTNNFTFKESTSATVKADGSTVITVKYTRNVYTITWGGRYYYDADHHRNETVKPGTGTITAKYGASITQLWKDEFNTPYPDYAWSFTTKNDDKFVNIDTMPTGNKTVNAFYFATTKTQTLHYWLEGYTGPGVTQDTKNGVTYGLYKAIDVNFNYLYDVADFYEIVGYTKGDYSGCKFGSQTTDGQQVHFYYLANNYTLDLYGYNGEKLSSHSVKLNANISSYLQAPSTSINGATFSGWYVDPAHKELYAGDYKMPTGLALYAGLVLPEYEITYISDGAKIHSETVEYLDTVTDYLPAEREGYLFVGWFTDQEFTKPFDANAPITDNVTVYAKWSEKLDTTYTVRYMDGDTVISEKTFPGKVGATVVVRAEAQTGYEGLTIAPGRQSAVLVKEAANNVFVFQLHHENDLAYTVRYVRNGAPLITKDRANAPAVEFSVYPTQADVTALRQKGYAIAESSKRVTFGKDAHVYVDFETNCIDFTITYKGLEDATGWEDNSTSNPNPGTYTVETPTFGLVNPVREGYTFEGWTTTASAESGSHNGLNVIIAKGSRGDLVFTATWKEILIPDVEVTKTADKTEDVAAGETVAYTITVTNVGNADLTDLTVNDSLTKDTWTIESLAKGASKTFTTKYVVTSSDAAAGKILNEVTVTGSGLENERAEETVDVKDEITVTAKSASLKYNGSEQSVSGLVDGSFTFGGAKYTVEANVSAKGTDVGTYKTKVEEGSVKVKDAAGNDVTGKFVVTVEAGELTITKRSVTLTSATANKEYDGTALTKNEVIVGGDKFANDEGADYTVTGNQTVVGSSENTFTYKLKDGTKASNYEILTSNGTLTVTNRAEKYEITVEVNSDEVKYDGKAKTVSGFKGLEFTENGKKYIVSGITASETKTDAGTYKVFAEGTPVVKDAAGNNVTEQFSVTVVPGTLTITKRSVTLTSASDSRVFNGTALTNNKVTVDGDGFAEGEGAAYTVTGSQTYVGNSKNTFEYTLNANTKAGNYEIEKVEGELTVTNRTAKYEITVTAKSHTEKYDGTAKSVNGFETLTFEVDGLTYKVSGLTASASGTDAGTYPAEVKGSAVVKDASNKDVTAQFTVKTEDGKLTITKRSVVLTSETAEKEYDGTALTAKEVTVSGDGFIEGEGASYNVTGTQTVVGNSANTFTYKLNDGTKDVNYEVTTANGTLTVTNRSVKYPITVTAKSGSRTYDGQPVTMSGFEKTTFTVEGKAYTVSGLTASVTETDAGRYTVPVTGTAIVKDAAGNDVTAQFAVTTVPGTLTISKRLVTLTSGSAEKEYDGTPLTKDEVKAIGFVTGEGASYTVSGSQTYVGSSENTFEYTLNAKTKAENYTINVVKGTLTVTDRTAKYEITVEANSGSKKYDGQPLTVSGFEKTTFEVAGNTYTVEGLSAKVTAANAGTYTVAVEGNAIVRDAAGNDVTAQFTVKTVDGKLTISKRNVTLTSATDEKEFDGTPLTNSEVTVSGDGFAAGEGAAYTVSGSQTYVGSSKNEFTYNLNAGTETGNYTIKVVEGELKVTDRATKYEVTVEANSAEYKYDGTEKSVSGFKTLTFTAEGRTYTVSGLSARAKATNAGTYDAKVTGIAVVKDAAGNDVTAQFTVKTVDGKLEISKRSVILTSETASKEYDGTALTAKEISVSGDGFAAGEGAAYNVTGTQTLVGNSVNTFEYALNAGTNKDNYVIQTAEGTLSVTNRKEDAMYVINVRANNGEFLYDGTEKSVSGLQQLSYEWNGITYTVSGLKAEAAGTDAGEYPVNVTGTAVVKDPAGNDVTKQFKINTFDGKLVINKRTVTLTSATDSKEYDGKALTNGNVSVGGDGFAKGEGAAYDVTGTQTLAGTSANTFTYTLNKGTKAGNYTITTAEGTLTVSDREAKYTIKVVANSDSKKYDGQPMTVSGFKQTTFEVAGNSYTVEGLNASVEAKNAGTYTVAVAGTAVVKDAAGNDVTAQFTVETEDGKLTIGKRSVTLTSETASKEYDGTALTAKEVTVSGDGFVSGEGAAYDVTGSQTYVGSSKNAFEYTLNANTEAENYTINKVEGNLKVTNRETKYEVTVKANSGEFKYDGTPKSVSGFETLTFEVAGNTYTVSGVEADVTKTDAEEYPVAVTGTAVVKDAAGNDVTEQFTVKTENGKLVIGKRSVVLTSATADKEYDGTALTAKEVTVSGDGFVENEGAAYDVTGTQTLAGGSSNTFTYTLSEGTKASNYDIKTVEGTLTVKDRAVLYEITVEAKSGSKKYDGKSMTVSGLKETAFEVAGNTYTVSGLTAEATGTDAGEYPVNVTGTAVVKDATGNDVTSQFKVHAVNGTLTISKRQLTLTSATDSKQYDGKALTNNTVTVAGDGFATGEGAGYTVTGAQTLPGSNANAFTYTLNAGTKTDNYDITKVEGTLTVTDRTQKYAIEVTANSGSYLYDGAEKAAEGFGKLEFTVAGNTYKVTGIAASAAAKNAGTYPVAVAGTPIVTDAAGNDVTNQFEVTCKPGTLSILPRLVTLTSASGEKDFDGSALTNHEVAVSGDGFVDGEGASYDVTGTQTLPGYSANTFTYELNAGTIATNYEITTVQGTLTVKDREELYEITVEANSGSKTYDGQPLTVSGLKETTFTVDGNVYTVSGLTAEVSNTDAGTYPVNVVGTAVVTDAAGNDVTRQFSVATKNGQLKINRKQATLTSASDSKKYDGTQLTNDTVTPDGFVEGQGASCNVTGSQTFVGSSKNTFTYTLNAGTKASNYTIKTVFGTLTVTDGTSEDPVDPVVVVGKTHEDGKVYGLGDVITFSIVVTNIYDEAREVTITENAGVTLENAANGVLKVAMAAGEQKTFTATYTVSEDDILSQSYTNTVNVDFGEKDFDDTDEVKDPEIEDADPSLVIDKETTNAKESGFALGETIEYKITVTNDGNLTLTNVVVTDELTGDNWMVPSLVPGASKEFTADYVVTEADVVKGNVTNVATATGENKSDKPVEITPDEITDKTEEANPSIVVDKTVENAQDIYKLGDTISYKIVVTNDGNLTLTNVEVFDELTGETWNVPELAVKESKTFTFTYLVTAQDIAAEGNTILNVATATGDNPSNKPTASGKDEVVTPIEEEAPGIAVVKELVEVNENAVPNAYKAAAGDVLTYTVKVTNTGNVIISDITVNDELVNFTETIEKLEPGQTETYEVSYTVVEADIVKGEVVNNAAAEGKDPANKSVEAADDEITATEDKNPDVTVDKAVVEEINSETGEAKAKWIVGDTIKYEIIVKNTGNITLTDLTVDDDMNAAGDAKFTNIAELIEGGIAIEEVDQDTVVLKSLAPGAEVKVLCEYTILRDDAGKEISNIAVADNEQVEPKADEEPTPIERLYNLTIHYVDAAGRTLAQDYVEKLVEGEIVEVASPTVSGYTTNVLVVTTAPDGMPAKDVEIYVVYTAIPKPEDDTPDPESTQDPETPEEEPTPAPAPAPAATTVPTPVPEISESGTYAIVEDGEGGYILTPIEEIEVPLADIDLDDHKCCILHFLIMLAAFIILAVHLNEQKKRQARIFELKETIELEKVKKDLSEETTVSETEEAAKE